MMQVKQMHTLETQNAIMCTRDQRQMSIWTLERLHEIIPKVEILESLVTCLWSK